MEEQQNAAYYLRLINQAGSYHDLVILRSRFFGLMDRSLTKEECQKVRDLWSEKAKDESLPIAPSTKA